MIPNCALGDLAALVFKFLVTRAGVVEIESEFAPATFIISRRHSVKIEACGGDKVAALVGFVKGHVSVDVPYLALAFTKAFDVVHGFP